MDVIPRNRLIKIILGNLKYSPIVALLGPRQCGKTTIAHFIAEKMPTEYFDLEDPADINRLSAPMLALKGLNCLVIIDEIQRQAKLFEILRVLVDQKKDKRKFLILGSASPKLIRNIFETLAGRVAFVEMSGFNLNEIKYKNYDKLWQRGGFPRSYLAAND